VLGRRTPGVIAAQHRKGGKQHAEDEAVAHQVDPEAQRGAVAIRVGVFVQIRGQLGRARSFHLGHMLGLDVEGAVIVEGVEDRGADDGRQRNHSQPPDLPDQRETADRRDAGQHDTGPGAPRHVDVLETAGRAGNTLGLHVGPGVDVGYLGREGEVVFRRRRIGRPFHRTAAPEGAAFVLVFFALPDRHVKLDHHRADTGRDQQSAAKGDPVVDAHRFKAGIEHAHTTRHAHEAQHIERGEGDPETRNPAPERHLAPELVQLEAESLGPPVVDRGKHAPDHAADDAVMEVGDQEHRVVQHEVGSRHGHHHAGHAADGQGEHEGDGPQHRQFKADAATEHGEEPVEQLGPGGDRDHRCGDAEERVHGRARTHGEEVVQPDRVGQDADDAGGVNHRGVAEQALRTEGRDDFRVHAEDRQHQNVHCRVAPEPDQVDIEHRRAAEVIGEEVGVEHAVQTQQGQNDGQHREHRNDQDVGDQGGPGEHG
ncbi:hypothetical protein E4T56_gene2522, partial [Termitomyces sp. T112]